MRILFFLFIILLPFMRLQGQVPYFRYPLEQEYSVSCRYGKMYHLVERSQIVHTGIDYAAPMGTPVLASADGEVDLILDKHPGMGNMISIAHENGYSTKYLHLSRVLVTQGQLVNAGDVIGHVGMTGKATGPHLHLEIRKYGEAMDPDTLLQPAKAKSAPAEIDPSL